MKNADDDLLPHIAALREAERTVFNSRLERNRLVVHIDWKGWSARLDSNNLRHVLTDLDATSAHQRPVQPRGMVSIGVDDQSQLAQLVCSRDDHIRATRRHPPTLVLLQTPYTRDRLRIP